MYELAPSRKIILAILVFGLVFMLGVSLVQRLSGDPLVVQSNEPASAEQSPMAGIMQEIGTHMEELKNDPNNFDMLVHTSDLLIQTEQWDAAESFLRRAITIDASKAQPHYLLGIALHNKEQHAEAAASLEKVIAINNDSSARYSLGVLYIYFLDKKNEGLVHLKKALEDSKLAADLRKAIEVEVAKAEQPASTPQN